MLPSDPGARLRNRREAALSPGRRAPPAPHGEEDDGLPNPQPLPVYPRTLTRWGEEDDVLPVEDAYKYEKDLPDCVGVTLIPEAQHAPALENPAFVAEAIIKFTKEKAWLKEKAVAA